MIERSELNPRNSVKDRSAMLSHQSGKRIKDDIELAQARPNPQVLKERQEVSSGGQLQIPIWESSRAEVYSSSPGLRRFVIWRYDPKEEGVIKYNSFDALDPLPHHYYRSNVEYEEARKVYRSGGLPDQLIDLNEYEWDYSSSSKSSGITVFPEVSKENMPQEESKAA